MGKSSRIMAKAAGFALTLSLALTVGVPGIAGAATPLFPQCPAAGADSGCGTLITINPDGSTTVATDPAQPALDGGTSVLVGVVNNSDVTLTSVALSGPGAFTLGGKGVCTVHPTPCFSAHEYGPTGYEGPGTSLTPSGSSAGTVNFSGGIGPGAGTFFSLSGSPISVTSVALQPGIDVAATAISPSTSVPFSGQVASFFVGTSVAPPANFTATVDWGDGTTDAGSVSQPGGPGTAYVVSDGHTYGAAGPYTDTVTVTDTTAPSGINSASDSATFNVVTQPVSISPASIAPQVAGTAFSGEVATFTSPVATAVPSDFTVSLDWGDGNTGAGTVTQPGGPGTPFQVSGSNTYATSNDYVITVGVTYAGVTTDGSVPIEVDAAQSTVPCVGSCTGTVTTPQESASGSTSGGTGSLFVSLSNGSLTCTSNTPYEYAPQITTVSTAGLPSTATVKVKVKFLRTDLQGPAGAPIEVCFASSHPFTTLDGNAAVPTVISGQNYYVGLLPACVQTKPLRQGPCLAYASKPAPGWPKTVSERVRFPAGDPKQR